MTDQNKYQQTTYVMALANGYSPLLRDELLSRSDLLALVEVETDATITLGLGNISFQRSSLFSAITAAYNQTATPVINTVDGSEWMVSFTRDAEPPNVVIEHKEQRFLVAQFALLAPDAAARLHAFQLIAGQHQLPGVVINRWLTLLAKRVPTGNEILELRGELQNTPIGAVGAIRENLQSGQLSLDILVPRSEAYYEQLVGAASNATTVENCIVDVIAPFLTALLADGHQQQLGLAWHLCSHLSISQLIEREWKGDNQVLVDEIIRLTQNGDPISRTGAIEVGLRRVNAYPALAQPLSELIHTVIDEEPEENTDSFALLAALFNCIYGQMAKCRILAAWPPFARRLAALAHASLVSNHLLTFIQDRANFIRGLNSEYEGYFTLQTLLDMRLEPRWFPDLGSAKQWRNELLGRVWIAANSAPEAVKAMGLAERLIGDAPQAVINQIDRARILLPGPLEGGSSSQIELAPEVVIQIAESLKGDIATTSFVGLINASMLFRIPNHLVDLASEAFERCHYQIPIDEYVFFTNCLLGLASIAAVNRHTKLCDDIHIALRVGRHLNKGQLTAEEAFRVGVLASMAHVELIDWTERIGQFMTELALQDLAKEDADVLQSHLSVMCHLIPELWGTCGQAHAALGLILGR